MFLSTCASCLSLPGTRNLSSEDPSKSTVLSAQPDFCLHLFAIQDSSFGGPANFICQVSLIQDVNTWRRSSWPCIFVGKQCKMFSLCLPWEYDNMRWSVQFIFVSKHYLNVQKHSAWWLVVNCVMKCKYCKCCAIQRGLYPIHIYMLSLYPFARFSFRLVYNFLCWCS